MPERQCPDDFLLIPLCGVVNVRCNGSEQLCRPGHCAFIAEGHRHTISYAPTHHILEVLTFHLRINDADGLPVLHTMDHHVLPLPIAETKDYQSLVSIFNHDAIAGNQFANTLITRLLFSWALAGTTFRQHTIHDPRISQALQRIHQNPSEDMHVTSIASEVGLGSVQFRKLFRSTVGQSPKLYIAHFRLRCAATELCNNNDSIKDIALRVGFADEHYFHNSFKRFYNCTPTEYRLRKGI